MAQVRQNLVGERVREARRVSRPLVTQQELSRRLAKQGISIDRAGIAKIEAGIRGVLDYELVALAKALNREVTWLLGTKG
jgi:hypothetical protein